MRIAHITPVYPPYRAGIGHVAFEEVKYLKQMGEEAKVFTPQYLGLQYDSEVEALKGLTWGKAAVLPQLLWRLRDFDVIHLHYPFYGSALFTALAALVWQKRLIVTYHMKTKGSGLHGFIFRWQRRLVEPIILFLAEIVLVSSVDYASSIGLRHRNLIDMPFGVDTEEFCPKDKFLARKKLQIDPDSFIFIFVGALDDAHYFKGVDVLLAAAAKIRTHEYWKLLLVGGGNREKMLRSIARELDIEDKVIFAGFVSQEDLPDYYRSADAHILPAIDQSEAFGLVTLEAGATGIPSFVSALPGVRTLVLHRETGLHIPVNNVEGLSLALQWALEHREKCLVLGLNARQRVLEKYAKETCLGRLHALYKGGKLDLV
ncbi:MAG: glycosyltransferase family 4 protein [Patescibacteria group bacterium]